MTNSIDHMLAYQIAAGHFPGALVHVERGGQPVFRRAAGVIGPDSDTPMHEGMLFRVASLTKPLVTVVALTLVDEGRLELDAPIGDILPAFSSPRMKSGARPQCAPTVRDLMRHTSGLAYAWEVQDAELREALLKPPLADMPGITAESFVANLAALPLVAEPGTTFRYGYSTDVLGCIVEKVAGIPLRDLLRTRLFEPLGMRDSGFEVPSSQHALLASAHAHDQAWHTAVPKYGMRLPDQPWMDSGGGGLVSTIGDYATFARMLANGGCVGTQRLVSAKLFSEMCRNQLPAGVDGPSAYCGSGFGFGLGLAVRLDGGPAAMPCTPGEVLWSGISGTAMFVQPAEQWFALMFSCNLSTRMMVRLEFRRAAARL
ncbi:MAG: serine hydrolase domain-containing protein [Sterolibacterium sp.]